MNCNTPQIDREGWPLRCSPASLRCAPHSLVSAYSPSTSTSSQSENVSDLRNQLRSLQKVCEAHSEQLKHRHDVGAPHTHCEHLANVYRDLTELTESDVSLVGDGTSLLRNIPELIECLVQATVDRATERHVSAVYDVLADFKEELRRTQQSMEDRLGSNDKLIQDLRESLRQCREEQRAIAESVQKSASERNRSNRKRDVMDDGGAEAVMDDYVTQRTLNEALSRQRDQLGQVVTQDVMGEHVVRQIEACDKLYSAKLAALVQDVQRVQSCVDSHVQQRQQQLRCDGELAELDARTRRKAKALSRRVEMMSTTLDAIQQAQIDARHAHEVQGATSALQHDLIAEQISNIQQQLERHTAVHNELRSHCALAGSFAELRDWLTDLEQRVASRAETSEATSRLEARLATVETELRVRQIDSTRS